MALGNQRGGEYGGRAASSQAVGESRTPERTRINGLPIEGAVMDSKADLTDFCYAFPDGEMGRWASLGAITDRSVRVWYRDPTLEPVRAVLLVDDKALVDGELRPDPGHDGIAAADLVLDTAMPDTAFTVRVASLAREGRFAPADCAPARFRGKGLAQNGIDLLRQVGPPVVGGEQDFYFGHGFLLSGHFYDRRR